MALSPEQKRPETSDLVAGQYFVDLGRQAQGGGGLPCFHVEDRKGGRTGLVALQVRQALQPRARALGVLTVNPAEHVLNPISQGVGPAAGGANAYYVIAQGPPGPSLAVGRRSWSESELVETVLRPLAHALDALQARRLTHRGVRPDMIFQTAPGEVCVLGCSWAAPGAAFQPALFEPPYVSVCPQALRGDGSIADDIYALGVTLVLLMLGHSPLADLPENEVIRRKLDLGSFNALVGSDRLPPLISDLARGMLAEDPEHRPPPVLLLDPAVARGRRVAARPPRRAQRSLELDTLSIWDARGLAQGLAQRMERGVQVLRMGVVEHWLRRILGEPVLAGRVEEIVRQDNDPEVRADPTAEPMLVMRVAAVLDPLAPLWWRGVALWPDGVPAGMAEALVNGTEGAVLLEELVERQVAPGWAEQRSDRVDQPSMRMESRQLRGLLRLHNAPIGRYRLAYATNPLLSCLSPLLGGRCVPRVQELLPALDRAATQAAGQGGGAGLIDDHVAAFIAARAESGLASEALNSATGTSTQAGLNRLRAFAALQGRYCPIPLPGICSWLVADKALMATSWRSKTRRAALAAKAAESAKQGSLVALLEMLDSEAERAEGMHEARMAQARLQQIDNELTRIANGSKGRSEAARTTGREIAIACGVAALAFAILSVF